MQQEYTKIESPIANFHNITLKLTQELEEVFLLKYKNTSGSLTENNNIVFVNNEILLFNFIKLTSKDNRFFVKTLRPMEFADIERINQIYNNYTSINQIYNQYLMMFNIVAKNVDDIPVNLVNDVINNINKEIWKQYLLPYKNKLSKLDHNCGVDFTAFEYMVDFSKSKVANCFDYNIVKVTTMTGEGKLSANKSVDNLDYLDKEVIKSGVIHNDDAERFVTELFYYGNILKNYN